MNFPQPDNSIKSILHYEAGSSECYIQVYCNKKTFCEHLDLDALSTSGIIVSECSRSMSIEHNLQQTKQYWDELLQYTKDVFKNVKNTY